MSFWGKCLLGEVSFGGSVFWGKCLLGETVLGEMSQRRGMKLLLNYLEIKYLC